MGKIQAVVFDFDGTISTLRAGWEQIMRPHMLESIIGGANLTAEEVDRLTEEVDAYIDQSTGIQTIYQMQWLADTVRSKGWNAQVLDPWDYKAEYNRRLLEAVKERVVRLERGELAAEDYLIKGSAALVKALHERGIAMYVASGTDHPDVVREAGVLGLVEYFTDIAGAPVGKAACSKEKVLQDLIEIKGIAGESLAVIGDGKVEIALCKQAGGLALGLASDEEKREGLNPVKEKRLRAAGADWIAGDFADMDAWLDRLGARG